MSNIQRPDLSITTQPLQCRARRENPLLLLCADEDHLTVAEHDGRERDVVTRTRVECAIDEVPVDLALGLQAAANPLGSKPVVRTTAKTIARNTIAFLTIFHSLLSAAGRIIFSTLL